MESTQVEVACRLCRGGRARVSADVSAAAPGLAVHFEHVHGPERRVVPVDDAWVVTHVASGLVVGNVGYRERGRAEAALALLGSLPVDWTLGYEALQAPELVALIRDALTTATR